jgi:uncharacterized membrane protein
MNEQDKPQRNGTPRWVKIVLIVSVAANLGIVGIVGGAALRAPEAMRNNVEAPDGVAMLARAMPPEFQRAVRRSLRDSRADLHPDRRELARLRDHFVEALRTEPFEINAVNRVFTSQRRMLDGLIATGHDAVIEQIEAMTLRDRENYIRRLLGRDHPAARP